MCVQFHFITYVNSSNHHLHQDTEQFYHHKDAPPPYPF